MKVFLVLALGTALGTTQLDPLMWLAGGGVAVGLVVLGLAIGNVRKINCEPYDPTRLAIAPASDVGWGDRIRAAREASRRRRWPTPDWETGELLRYMVDDTEPTVAAAEPAPTPAVRSTPDPAVVRDREPVLAGAR